MAVTERGGGPAVASVSSSGFPSVSLTGAQQPQTGDWLLIVHGNDYYALSDMTAPTVGGSTTGVVEVTGTGLPADGGSFFAHRRVWKYFVASGGSDLTVAAVEGGVHDEEKFIAVHVLVGADSADCIDIAAGAFNSTGSTNHVAPDVSPTTAGYLICGSNDGNGANGNPFTSPGSMTEQYDANAGGLMGYVGAVEQLASPGATGTRTFTGGNTTYAASSIVIKAAAGGATPSLGQTSTLRHPGNGPGRFRFSQTPRPTDITAAVVASGSATASAHVSTADSGVKGSSGSATASAHVSTTSSGVKGAAGSASPSAHVSTADSGVKRAQGSGAPSARSSTVDSGVKAAFGAGLLSAHVSTTDAGVKKATGTGTASAHVTTQATTAVPPGGPGLPGARTSTVATGQRSALGVGTASAHPSTTQAGIKKATATGLPSAHVATVAGGKRSAAGVGRASARALVESAGHQVVALAGSTSWRVEQAADVWTVAPAADMWTVEQAPDVWQVSQA